MPALVHKKDLIHYVIVGNSAAGITAAREIRRHDPAGRITILSDEAAFGYSRVMLPLYITGKISKKQMVIAPRSFYPSHRIRLLREDPVESIAPKSQRIFTRKGVNLSYDRLLVATGSSPTVLEIPGSDLQGIHYLRKIADAEGIKKDLSLSRGPVLVVGGGLVGVKSLEALVARKRKVHLVISSNQILSQILDRTASDFFLDAFKRNGVDVHLHTDVKSFYGREKLEGAFLSDGKKLSCDLAIIGKGVKPNVAPLAGTGVAINQGLVVDHHMATNLPFIYAAGDVVETFDVIRRKNSGNAIWPLAIEGGRIAGSNMASVPAVFSGGLRMNSVDVLGTRAISAGEREGEHEIKSFCREGMIYRKLVVSEGRLKGFILTGDVRCAGILTSLVKNQKEVSISALEEGLDRGFSFWLRLQVLGGHIQEFIEEGGKLENRV